MKRRSTFDQRQKETGPSADSLDPKNRKPPVAQRTENMTPEAPRNSILRQDLAPGDLVSVLRSLFRKQ